MTQLGNKSVNSIFEAWLPHDLMKPGPSSDRTTREDWIRRKYVDKQFLAPIDSWDATREQVTFRYIHIYVAALSFLTIITLFLCSPPSGLLLSTKRCC